MSKPNAASRPVKHGAPEPIAALNRVRILEQTLPFTQREPLVDVRVACPDVVWTERVCPYLRRSVAEMVNKAQAALPPGCHLRAGTALRTLAMQSGGWDGYFRRMQEEHPTWPLSALRRATNKYYAPYDQKAPPGHCTGGAIDVGINAPDGSALDMIAPTEGWQAAYTWSDLLSPEAKANRMLMVEAMLGAGFSNCRDEYWHYSYGDSAWAVRVGEKECPYGWAHPPVALETDFEGASAADLQIETERDAKGLVLSAKGSCALPPEAPLTPEGQPRFSVGLYWANGVPVTLHLHWPARLPMPDLYLGDGKEEGHPVTDFERQGDTLTLRILSLHDRRILTNVPPTPAAEEKPTA
jgi:D-alanyl-D-alanine dipeptidase